MTCNNVIIPHIFLSRSPDRSYPRCAKNKPLHHKQSKMLKHILSEDSILTVINNNLSELEQYTHIDKLRYFLRRILYNNSYDPKNDRYDLNLIRDSYLENILQPHK